MLLITLPSEGNEQWVHTCSWASNVQKGCLYYYRLKILICPSCILSSWSGKTGSKYKKSNMYGTMKEMLNRSDLLVSALELHQEL